MTTLHTSQFGSYFDTASSFARARAALLVTDAPGSPRPEHTVYVWRGCAHLEDTYIQAQTQSHQETHIEFARGLNTIASASVLEDASMIDPSVCFAIAID